MSRLAPSPAPPDGAGASAAKTPAAAAPSGLLAIAKHPVVTYLLLLGQFALLWRLAIKFNLESAAFVEVLGVCVGAFAVHYWLPKAWRMAFFVAVSLLCVFLVFSWDKGGREFGQGAVRAGWLVGAGLVLIAICHLPIRWGVRVALLLAAGVGLALITAKVIETPVPRVVWPILAAMFMFRLLVYMYDLKHDKAKPSWQRAMAYFFMVPNPCFPLFPVVDYKTFARSHYGADSTHIHQTGLRWMVRGAAHLVLYRFVYYQIYLAPAEVVDGGSLATFFLTNFALYLRVSGQFHIIVGLLHMFGFNLPESNRRYFLASSFTDYWRRVNIYWKDFILKVVYYPAYFKIKRIGDAKAMALATMWAFVITWALHAYQVFWLKGVVPLPWKDVVFWGALGVLVTINSVLEARGGRTRSLTKRKPTMRERLVRSGKVAGTFLTLCVLWSIWSCSSLTEWIDVCKMADANTAARLLGAALVAALLANIPALDPPPAITPAAGSKNAGFTPSLLRAAVLTCVLPALALQAMVNSRVMAKMPDQTAAIVKSLTSRTKPIELEQDVMERGYYEDLLDVGMVNSPLAEVLSKRPAGWIRLDQSDAMRLTGDIRFRELVPSKETVVNGVLYRTNEWGMRDDAYPKAKPAGTVRIGFLGASYAMGWGVAHEDCFEAVLEKRLNEGGGANVQALNFAVNGYSPLCQTVALPDTALGFDLDVAVFVSHVSDPYWAASRLARAVRKGVELPDPFLGEYAKRAGVGRTTPDLAAERRLSTKWPEMIGWAYQRMADQCREKGVRPVWLFVPRIGDKPGVGQAKNFPALKAAAEQAGFTVIDLSGVFDGYAVDDISLAKWDTHPNERGHRLIADKIYDLIAGNPALGIVAPPATPENTNAPARQPAPTGGT